jgi:3-keto-5-aminohexanoate cleavage enzyme
VTPGSGDRHEFMEPLIINAAITGMVPMPKDNPAVPITVQDIIADARRCAEAGASIVHVHAREADGRPTWRADIYREIIDGIRAACPGLLISGSTSGRLWPDFEKRAAVLDCQPDLASLTPGSLNFPTSASVNPPAMIEQLARCMRERGVRPELEFFDLGMIDYVRDYLMPRGVITAPCFANILLGSRGTAAASARNLTWLVAALPAGTTWAATGIGRWQFEVQKLAIAMGGHVRCGLEDNLWMDVEKTEPASNPQLIERVVQVAVSMGRTIATPESARQAIMQSVRPASPMAVPVPT